MSFGVAIQALKRSLPVHAIMRSIPSSRSFSALSKRDREAAAAARIDQLKQLEEQWPQSSDPASRLYNVPNFKIVDTTLREGEQFATTDFTSRDRIYIAKTLDGIGVDYIEMVNPLASKTAAKDCEDIAKLSLRAKVVTHTRCHMDDVRVACQTGIDGVNLYMATSPILSQHSHGKGIDEVIQIASEVIKYVQSHKMEVRFSCEDSFRSDKTDLLKIFKAVDQLGVQRVGIADTVGVATPLQVYETVKIVRNALKPTTDIEFHTHNDTGCCIANAYTALQGGATHIDTCVLGIGERNGITPLGGFLARMYTLNKDYVRSRFNLKLVAHLDKYVAQKAHISIPFNNYVTGSCAFTHKAGVHSKAVMSSPDAYEVIDPQDFGVDRRIQFAHRLTGWNAMKQRAKDLGLVSISDDQIKAATVSIKNIADDRSITLEEVDAILMKLASSSAPASQFIVWGDDKKAKHKHIQAQVQAAVDALEPAKVDLRPSQKFQVTGHLFDKAVLNRLLDIIVDSPCDFTVLNLNVASANAGLSSAVLQIWGESDDDVTRVRGQLDALVKALEPVAECSITDLPDAPTGSKSAHKERHSKHSA